MMARRGGFPGSRGGGFPGGGNMNQLMQQAQRMQREIEKAQEEAATMTGEATAGGGMVKVVVNSDHQIEELAIMPDVVDPDDIEMLQDLIIAAVNEAVRNLDEQVEARMSKATGGGIPGFPGF